MRLILEAFSPPEGTAIVRDGENLRLIRPPYLLRQSPLLPADSLQTVITKHGYVSARKEFSEWADLIDFLDSEVVSSRNAIGLPIPSSIEADEIIEVAPREILHRFLDQIETELIPRRMLDSAENFLIALLASNAIRVHPDIGPRVGKLLHVIKERRGIFERTIRDLAVRHVLFRSLARHEQIEASARLAETIKMRGCIFAPSS